MHSLLVIPHAAVGTQGYDARWVVVVREDKYHEIPGRNLKSSATINSTPKGSVTGSPPLFPTNCRSCICSTFMGSTVGSISGGVYT